LGSQGPWRGSPAADTCTDTICQIPLDEPVSLATVAMDGVRMLCACADTQATGAVVTLATKYSYTHPTQQTTLAFNCGGASSCTELNSIMSSYVQANLCGLQPSPMSFGFKSDTALPALAKLASWGIDSNTNVAAIQGNDGLVGMDSCRGGNARTDYQLQATSNLYAFPGNHADGTGRAGDTNTGAPLSWYKNSATGPVNQYISNSFVASSFKAVQDLEPNNKNKQKNQSQNKNINTNANALNPSETVSKQ